ncbi:hypothetical protein N9L26_02685 [Candidatus Pacebacteria bacterium]|nr:hypothetical protein [Candidatus Paceibacterota bacterium]
MNRDVFNSIEFSLAELTRDVMNYLPELIVALLLVIVGWILGGLVKSLVMKLIKMFNIDDLLDKAGVDTLVQKAGHKFRPAHFVGTLMKWFVILVFVVAALDVLNLGEVTQFFRDVVLVYLPRVIVAALILLGAMIVARLAGASVEAAARAGGFNAADMIGTFTRYAIIIFAVMAALNQLQIAPELVQTLFAGLVFGLALAFGLAFGLGGRETAARYLTKLDHEMTGSAPQSNHNQNHHQR